MVNLNFRGLDMEKRRRHSANFKAKVAVEAVKNDQTVNELASKYQVHPTQISQWKKELLDGVSTVFEKESKAKRRASDPEKKIGQLHQKIGQLTVEVDWLKKN